MFVRKRFTGHCTYSGYDRIFDFLGSKKKDSISITDTKKNRGWFPHTLFQFLKLKYNLGTPFYNHSSSLITEIQAFFSGYKLKPKLIHFGYLEDHYGFFRWAGVHNKLSPTRIIATTHHPVSWWKIHGRQYWLDHLDSLIVLSRSDVVYFNNILPDKVHFVPHGVDTDFFKPAVNKKSDYRFRCIFVGQWLRDIETLVYVVENLLTKKKDMVFDIFFPQWKRSDKDYLYRIINNPNVSLHNHVSDEELRSYYQKADILLIPLFDCTANNAILEGMACGLPIISNDVPGIHTYVNDSFSTLVPVADVGAMVDTVMQYYEDPSLVAKQSEKAREHTLANFTWDNIANQMMKTYNRILK